MSGLAVVATVAVVAAAAPHGPPFAFGGWGPHGPYTVTIATDGSANAVGNGGLTRIGTPQLSLAQVAVLNRAVARARFGNLPVRTRCGDASRRATSWIQIGGKRVTVAGTCVAAYQRLFKALTTATHFYSG